MAMCVSPGKPVLGLGHRAERKLTQPRHHRTRLAISRQTIAHITRDSTPIIGGRLSAHWSLNWGSKYSRPSRVGSRSPAQSSPRRARRPSWAAAGARRRSCSNGRKSSRCTRSGSATPSRRGPSATRFRSVSNASVADASPRNWHQSLSARRPGIRSATGSAASSRDRSRARGARWSKSHGFHRLRSGSGYYVAGSPVPLPLPPGPPVRLD